MHGISDCKVTGQQGCRGFNRPSSWQVRSRAHDSVIRTYDDAGNVIETHEHTGPGVHVRIPLDQPPAAKTPDLGCMLDEKMFAFYYELPSNSR
jgi:hypothetical protein